MTPDACCLPAPLPTRHSPSGAPPRSLARALTHGLRWRVAEGLRRLRSALARRWFALQAHHLERRRRAALRGLSAHILRDIGLGEYASRGPARPQLEWDADRWQ